MKQKFLDPLYGPIEVDDFTRSLVFSPDFQRLRYVRLCNINSLFITGASEPKRFEHCLGVYHLANVWAEAVGLGARERKVVRAAALLHDLQTGPFGHSFQYVLEDNAFDQQFEHANITSGVASQFLQLANAGASFSGRQFIAADLLGDDSEDVFKAIRGEGSFGPIISGTLDLDNLDNVVRLAYHMGICSDSDRLLPLELTAQLRIYNSQLAATRNARPLFQRWYEIRKKLYEYLLLDRGEFSAKAMLTMAVELAAEAKLIGPDSWRLTDDELLNELENASVGENQAIGQIIRRLRLGNLFDCIGVWQNDNISLYETLSEAAAKRSLENEIQQLAVDAGAIRLNCCIHYIVDHKKTCRQLKYIDENSSEQVVIGENSRTLLTGLFVTNDRMAPPSISDIRRYERAAFAALEKMGLNNLSKADEPLAQHTTIAQSELFSA